MIRTFVGLRRQVYSLLPLTARAPLDRTIGFHMKKGDPRLRPLPVIGPRTRTTKDYFGWLRRIVKEQKSGKPAPGSNRPRNLKITGRRPAWMSA